MMKAFFNIITIASSVFIAYAYFKIMESAPLIFTIALATFVCFAIYNFVSNDRREK